MSQADALHHVRDRVRPSRPGALFLAVGVLLAAVAAGVATTLTGTDAYSDTARDYPGLGWGLLTGATRALADVAGWVTIGCLGASVLLAPSRRRRRSLVCETSGPDQGLLERAAGFWVLGAGASAITDAADLRGIGPGALLSLDGIGFAYFSGSEGRAWTLTLLVALTVWLFCPYARSWQSRAALVALTLPAVLGPIVIGQVLVGPNHDLGSDAAIVQTVALVGVWSVAMHALHHVGPGALSAKARRLGLASVAFALAGEVVVAWIQAAGTAPWSTPTGLLATTRVLCLVVVGVALSRPAPPRWLLVAPVGVFAAAGVTMMRIPPPQYFVPTSIQQIYLGFDVGPAPDAVQLLTSWRPNLLFLTLAVVAMVGYGVGVRRLHSRGQEWPWGRTVAWFGGWGVVVVATSSGTGRYSSVNFAVHMGVHMSIGMVAPVLLSLGGAVALLLRAVPAAPRGGAPGVHEWVAVALNARGARLLFNPLAVFSVYVTSLYVIYFSDLYVGLMATHWGHQLMNLTFLGVGLLYFGLVIGVDPAPRTLPALGKLGFLVAAMPFHAYFGVILMTGRVIGEDYYRRFDLAWAPDLQAVQRLAGGIAWVGSEVPILMVVIALAIQWARQDASAARPVDRGLEAGFDSSSDDYDALLARINERDHETTAPPRSQDPR